MILNEKEMKRLFDIVLAKNTHNRKILKITLNNIYVLYDYFFFDIAVENKSNIAFERDQVCFKTEDEKMGKVTNFQQLEVTPKYQTNPEKAFTKLYHNVFVFEKFTFPDDKVFTIELAQSQISSGAELLKVKYKEVLNADKC